MDKTQSSKLFGDLKRIVKVETIPENGRSVSIETSFEERRDLARMLDLLSLEALTAQIDLRPVGPSRVSAGGWVRAKLIQACVISLEPVESVVDETIDTEFWPVEEVAHGDDMFETGDNFDPFGKDGPELVENGQADLGKLIFEILTTAINPYPRQPDAHFSWGQQQDEMEEAEEKVHPFSALKVLKAKGSDRR